MMGASLVNGDFKYQLFMYFLYFLSCGYNNAAAI